MSDQALGQLRHILGFVGGLVVAFGWFDEAEVTPIINDIVIATGAISAIIAAVWSWKSKDPNSKIR